MKLKALTPSAQRYHLFVYGFVFLMFNHSLAEEITPVVQAVEQRLEVRLTQFQTQPVPQVVELSASSAGAGTPFKYCLEKVELLAWQDTKKNALADGTVELDNKNECVSSTRPTSQIVRLSFHAGGSDPGKYVGRLLFLTNPQSQKPVEVPVDVYVRSPPALGWLLVTMGVLLGILNARLIAPVNEVSRELLRARERRNRLEEPLKHFKFNPSSSSPEVDPVTRSLKQLLQATWLAIKARDLTAAQEYLTLTSLTNRVANRYLSVQTELQSYGKHPAALTASDRLQVVENLLLRPDPIQADAELTQILAQPPFPATAATPALTDQEKGQPMVITRLYTAVEPRPLGFMANFNNARTNFLTSVLEVSPYNPFWGVAGLALMAMLILLVVYAFATLYLSNPSFGSDVVRDYLGAVLWGIAGGYAGKTLTDFAQDVAKARKTP